MGRGLISLQGGACRLLATASAAVAVLAFAFILGTGSARATDDNTQLQLDCIPSNQVVVCKLIVDRKLASDAGVTFTASLGGSTQTVTATADTDPTWRTSYTCGNSDGVCYRFIFTPESFGDDLELSSARIVGDYAQPLAQTTQDGTYPCADNPAYTCSAEAPSGTGVVAVHNDGDTVTFDEGNNGIDETDEEREYDASSPAGDRKEVQTKKEVTDSVTNIPEDDMVVITAANGTQSSGQQENAFSLEQALWERGQPYTVCFDPVTYTDSNGEEVTVQDDCVVVTPN